MLHLWEFRSLVWILNNRPNTPCKMLPKAQQKIFIRFDDRAYTIKYYNKETCKILISQNYHFNNNPYTIST